MKKFKIKEYIDKIRPGVITGAADNDPSGIASYSISGSQFGYSQNWLMIISIPMLIAIQGTVARIGIITKKGLNEILKNEYGKTIAFGIFFILIICNTFTIGADMLATSASIDMFFTNNTFDTAYILIPLFILLTYIIIFKNYKKIAKYMFWTSLIFLSYFITVILVHPNIWNVLKGTFIPNIGDFLNKNYALTATGILGTTISPYLLFWQQEEEQEEKRHFSFVKKERGALSIGFIFSQLMTIFIMTAAGATLHKEHINILNTKYPAIATASVLKPLAGVVTEQLFALGIISAGLIAIPVLAISSGYALTELTQKRSFLSHKFKERKLFYYIIIISLLAGFVFSIFKVNTIDALYYSQVLDGILAPIIVIFIIIIANNKKLMGENTNRLFDNFFAILSLIIMIGASLLIFI